MQTWRPPLRSGVSPSLDSLEQVYLVVFRDRLGQALGIYLAVDRNGHTGLDGILKGGNLGNQCIEHLPDRRGPDLDGLLPTGKAAKPGPEVNRDEWTIAHDPAPLRSALPCPGATRRHK